MKDITGMIFGRLTAIKPAEKNKHGRWMWLCKCSCGNEKIVSSNALLRGYTKSCGCLDKEKHITHPNRRTHGQCGTRLYRIWKAMKKRCFNENNSDYKKWYGSHGVTVCNEWLKFEPFYEWAIVNGYSDDLSIDRINPYGNYEPNNCRWATPKEQANNKRKKVM